MRRWSCIAIFALALAPAGCGDQIYGTISGAEPLAIVRGRLEGGISIDTVQLRAGILWAGVPAYNPYCQENGPNPLEPDRPVNAIARAGCRNPFRVVPALPGPSVPITPAGGSFEIPIYALPDPYVMVGDPGARVAYASLIVFDDRNEDGRLNFQRPCALGEDPTPPDPTLPPDPADADPTQPVRSELIFAASFVDLLGRQTRIAYVEGPFDEDSFFYPHPLCEALPPQGFSVWSVGNLLDSEEECSVHPIDTEIVISPALVTNFTDLGCRDRSRNILPRPPPDYRISANNRFECLADGGMALIDPTCLCHEVRIYELKGCYGEYSCEVPDWDVDPPSHWPCRGNTGQP